MALILFTVFIIFFATDPALAESPYFSSIEKQYPKEHKEILDLLEEDEALDGDDYLAGLKELYFRAFKHSSEEMLRSKQKTDDPNYEQNKSILSELEYREEEVDKIIEEVNAHINELERRAYLFTKRLFIDYVSWQREVELNSATAKNKLIVNNSGVCLGGALSMESSYYIVGIDGCFFSGSGDVKERKTPPNYNESDVPMHGIRASLSAGAFVSPAKAEIGLKLPVLYTNQDLADPPSATYKVKEDTAINIMATLYSRWPLGRYFLQTEIGTFLGQDSTFYSIGGGYKF